MGAGQQAAGTPRSRHLPLVDELLQRGALRLQLGQRAAQHRVRQERQQLIRPAATCIVRGPVTVATGTSGTSPWRQGQWPPSLWLKDRGPAAVAMGQSGLSLPRQWNAQTPAPRHRDHRPISPAVKPSALTPRQKGNQRAIKGQSNCYGTGHHWLPQYGNRTISSPKWEQQTLWGTVNDHNKDCQSAAAGAISPSTTSIAVHPQQGPSG